ncbi:MAG: hypothetical protein HY866_15355 [Chloroflexi bacterium]|nr:hypothetical protein [Chloroflexota bacterium]
MKNHRRLWYLLALGGCLLLGAALSSCAPDTSAPELQPTITATPPETQVDEGTAVSETGGASGVTSVEFTDTTCLTCHTNQEMLKALAAAGEEPAVDGADLQVEAGQKFLIDAEAYAKDVHAYINCTTCHGGNSAASWPDVHTGLIANPSDYPEATCGTCHPNIAPDAAKSLHFTQAGYDTALQARSSAEHVPALDAMQSEQCESCHASCGDCHIGEPSMAGGGLLAGHVFVRTPPAGQTCALCHSSTVNTEYAGLNEGLPADVHLVQAQMTCTDCHGGDEMHGIGAAGEQAHRYDGAPEPACESCHADQVGIGSGIILHELHGTEILSCQACHSVAYSSYSVTADENGPSYSLEAGTTAFLLGKNPLPSAERPWRYVPLRHIPIDANSFSAYGENLLDNFLSESTWGYATPHNIQRNTPQTASCASCHSNDAVFLTPDKIAEGERAGANLSVMVDVAPPLPSNLAELMTQVLERINQSKQSDGSSAD